MELPVHIGKRIDFGRKEKDKARQAVFLKPTNLFGNDPEEKEPHDDCTFPQKITFVTRCKNDKNAVY